MPTIKVRGHMVDVDIQTELEQFNWTRPRWSSDKLIAASPFRYDQTPSFFVNLDGDYAGGWGDSGAYDAEWQSGGFVKLLAFLRNETTEETEDYLIETYSIDYSVGSLSLRVPRLTVKDAEVKVLPEQFIASFSEDFTYLKGRGISEEVQRRAGIRYDTKSRAVVIPWFDEQRRLRNVKYRTTYGKIFWYYKEATPIRELIYGIESVKGTSVVLEEAEIDALSWRQAGLQAIAVGGANFTNTQADIIKRSGITLIYVSGDNDKAGQKFSRQVVEKLRGFVEIKRIVKPPQFKDANEVLVSGANLRNCQIYAERSIIVENLRPKFDIISV